MSGRPPGLWIVFDDGPGPVAGRFVEVEDEHGRSVAMDGREWRDEGAVWALGPFLPGEMRRDFFTLEAQLKESGAIR